MVFAAVIQGSLAALPWMAEVLAPRGINAGFALNAIWLSAGLLMAWSLTAVTARRLRAVGHTPWWAPAAVLPLSALALVNDAIFLVSRSLVLPVWLNGLLLVACAALTAAVLATCLRGDR
jgi:uncharacterized membrane protein YhaH (DUF805 family)